MPEKEPCVSIVREISVRCQVSGKALAAGITASLVDQEPAASAVPLSYFSNDAKVTINARVKIGTGILRPPVCYLIQVILLAAAYLAAAMIGLAFAIPPGNATAVWPASGIALAAMLLLGMRVWPGVWLGALLANSLLTDVSLATAATIATGNTLEALLAAWLCRRLLPQAETPFQRVEEAFLFAVVAGVASTVAATVGGASLVLGGYAAWPQFLANWGTWWLGDVAGLMIVVPLVLACAKPRRSAWSGSRWAELAILFALMVLASQAIFGGWLSEQVAHHLLYIPLIFLVWVCLRFELAEVTLATALFSGAAIVGTWAGRGPFRAEAVQQSLFHLQMFMNLYALTGLGVGGRGRQTPRLRTAPAAVPSGAGTNRPRPDPSSDRGQRRLASGNGRAPAGRRESAGAGTPLSGADRALARRRRGPCPGYEHPAVRMSELRNCWMSRPPRCQARRTTTPPGPSCARTERPCRRTNIRSIESWPRDSRCGISCVASTDPAPGIAGGCWSTPYPSSAKNTNWHAWW